MPTRPRETPTPARLRAITAQREQQKPDGVATPESPAATVPARDHATEREEGRDPDKLDARPDGDERHQCPAMPSSR